MNRPLQSKHKNNEHSDALALAELIIQNSTSIRFRRLAADDPKKRKMVYVSPNISRFGYRAQDFLNDNFTFRDIVYQGDSDRTLQEIKERVENKSKKYIQVYRIVSKSGKSDGWRIKHRSIRTLKAHAITRALSRISMTA